MRIGGRSHVPPGGLVAGVQLLCSGHGTDVPVVRPCAGSSTNSDVR